MRVVAIKKIHNFWQQGHADSIAPLKTWCRIFKENDFSNVQEIKRIFPSCRLVFDNSVIFNVASNKYRLVVHVHYNISIAFIRFIGTHAEYDKINV